MNKWPMVALGEVMAQRRESVDPSKHPDEVFDLYSIPAFDTRRPDKLHGSEIGSSKQLVQTGDVLLSRIVPHIRRSWTVGPSDGARLIASGEWIVFRSSRVEPKWLSYMLTGDEFHGKFMQTVAGVGGSLLRARPTQVANIPIPLPPLPEQRRIAVILDRADDLRTKRQRAEGRMDELAAELFDASFSHYLRAEDQSSTTLGSLTQVQGGLQVSGKTRSRYPLRVHYLRVANVMRGRLDLREIKTIEATAAEVERTRLRYGGLLVVEGHGNPAEIGRVAMWVDSSDYNVLHQNHLIRVRCDRARLSPVFAMYYLNSPIGRQHLLRSAKTTSGLNTISARQVKEEPVPIPPLDDQLLFESRLDALGRIRMMLDRSGSTLDALFASLQTRAFAGDL